VLCLSTVRTDSSVLTLLVCVQVVITGLTKQKLGDTFAGLRNVTLATSNGLVYSWGQNLLPARHHTRAQLQHLASAAAAAAKALHGRPISDRYSVSNALLLPQPPISSALAWEENSTYRICDVLLCVAALTR
jgi:hypothetical protein